ncbi:MAG: hypothetical protein CFE21_21175 [Bacteroidetes bacterium B1(2017)]|nr:MAG: hypothetical protein CFE21_21175 [Bacteroidetes bacterium B1(2017)]
MKKNFFKNTFVGVFQFITTTIIILLCIPIFIKLLGPEQYGIFAILSVLGNLNIFANLGITTSLIKYLSEQGKSEESNKDIITAFTIILLMTTILTILLYIGEDIVVIKILQIPTKFYSEARILYLFLICSNMFVIIGQIFTAILDSQYKNYLTNILQLLFTIAWWSGVLITIMLGYGLKEIGLSIFCSTLIWFGFLIYYSMKFWGNLFITYKRFEYKKQINKHLNYSLKVYTTSLFGFLFEPLTKIMVSSLLGVKEVGYFDISLRIKGQIWGIITKLTYPLTPIIASNDLKTNRLIILKSQNIILFIIIPLLVIFFLCSEQITSIWLKININEINVALKYIIPFFLLGSTVIPSYVFLLYKNEVKKTILIQASNVIVNSLVILFTFKTMGFNSIVLGSTISIFTSFSLTLFFQKKYLGFWLFKKKSEFLVWLSTIIISIIIGNLILKISILDSLKITLVFISSTFITSMSIYYFYHKNPFKFFRELDSIRKTT